METWKSEKALDLVCFGRTQSSIVELGSHHYSIHGFHLLARGRTKTERMQTLDHHVLCLHQLPSLFPVSIQSIDIKASEYFLALTDKNTIKACMLEREFTRARRDPHLCG